MVADVLPSGRAVEPRPRRDIGLHAQNGFDPRLPRRPIELHCAIEDPMIGHRHRRLAVGGYRRHDLPHPGGAIQHGVFSVQVKMGETFRAAHNTKMLPPRTIAATTASTPTANAETVSARTR